MYRSVVPGVTGDDRPTRYRIAASWLPIAFRTLAALSHLAIAIQRMLGADNLQDPMDCLHLRPDASVQIVAG